MTRLRAAWEQHERVWVTFDAIDSRTLIGREERTVFAYQPTNRSLVNLMRNLWLARRVLREERPDFVVSTGGGVAVPFLWLARWFGARSIHCDSISYSEQLSLTARLVMPFVDRLAVQWPEVARKFPRTVYWGSVL
jgi:UDP-N-acetylglucosamine:LPS N-acetylglucosamine transferase